MRRPVCALFAGALAAQLIAAFEPQVSLGPLAAFFVVLSLGVLALGGPARGYGLWLLAGALAGIAFTARTEARLAGWISQYEGQLVRLTASVEEVREGYSRSTVRARLRVEATGIGEGGFCCWCDDLPRCSAGEKIEGVFTLESPDPDDRPGRYADEVVFLADYERQFEPLGQAEGFRAWGARLQQKLSGALCQSLEGDEAGALAAMVTGDRSQISSELNEAYRAAGLSHVLVVSGMHVTILCGMGLPGWWDLRRWLAALQKLAMVLPGRLGLGVYRRIGVHLAQKELKARKVEDVWPLWKTRLRALWPVVLAVLLTGITGFTPSVLRAAAAVAIGAFGVWTCGPADAMTSLALAGLGMSAFNSYAVCDVGFQLSYAAVLGTLAGAELARRTKRHPGGPQEEKRSSPGRRMILGLLREVWTAGCISLCASAATFPVLVLWGMSTSPYALVSGVAILWVVQPLMTLGILAALAGMIPALGPVYRVLAAGAELLARLLNGWARMVAGWPGARMTFDTRYAALVCLVVMGLCFLAYQWKVRPRFWVPAAALALAVGIGSAALLGREVVQVSVVGGARTPSVILAQEGRAVVLYRGGSSGRTAVEDWLESHGIAQADYLIDLRSDPARATRPEAGRIITAAWMGNYQDYAVRCGDIRAEVMTTPGGAAVRITVDRWQLGAVSGDFELASQVPVDWLLASPADPSAFRWEGVLALGDYDWMEPDTAWTAELLLRPGGGAKTRG